MTAMLVFIVCAPAKGGDAIWWDDFPGIIQTSDVAQTTSSHANAVLCGVCDDPCWGIYAQRMCLQTFGGSIPKLHEAGIKCLTWFEGFGTCESYVAQLRRDASGGWVLQSTNPALTRIYSQHWGWQGFDGTGEIRWVGLPNYFNNDDFARPWTLDHSRYGSPPMRYPDGRIATGYIGSTNDPRNSRVLDAGCSKDVLGRITFEYDYNEFVNRLRPETRQLFGPTNGLVRVENAPMGPPDPGFTPEEWRKIKKPGYAGVVSSGKDSACPVWIDYVRASVRAALDAGIDGLWVDNYSPWDSFNSSPIIKAFGEWSVAGFRDYLRTNFTETALVKMGATNTANYDIRSYLCARCREWGGNPEDLADAHWRDARFLEDPLWRAYLIYKRQAGAAALSRYYRVIKEESANAGKPEFLVMGNDIPLYSLGWVRGDLDMVSTELSWGWHLTSGPRGIMPPPVGNYTPVYKLAREHAKSRFVNAWMYGSDEQLGRSNIARVLYYQALANHAMPMPNPGGRTVGNTAVDSEFFAFLRSAAPIFKDRQAIEEVGLYYSSSSQLMEMTPGGFRDHNHQPHSFAFWGWGTALTQLHIPWRAVPEWKLTAETLQPLRLLIIPESAVFEPNDVHTLETWVSEGGVIVITGNSGSRVGEMANFEPAVTNALFALAGAPSMTPRKLGKGSVLRLRNDPGIPYYEADKKRGEMLGNFSELLKQSGFDPSALVIAAPGVPETVGLTLYRVANRMFVDVNNTEIDLKTDVIKETSPLQFVVTLPPELRGKKLEVRVIGPGNPVSTELQLIQEDHVQIKLGAFCVYASVIIEPAKN